MNMTKRTSDGNWRPKAPSFDFRESRASESEERTTARPIAFGRPKAPALERMLSDHAADGKKQAIGRDPSHVDIENARREGNTDKLIDWLLDKDLNPSVRKAALDALGDAFKAGYAQEEALAAICSVIGDPLFKGKDNPVVKLLLSLDLSAAAAQDSKG